MAKYEHTDPEVGITFTLARHAAFVKGSKILAAYALAAGDAVEPAAEEEGAADFMDFTTESLGDDMLAYVARVWLPGATALNEHGVEIAVKHGGVSSEDNRRLKRSGWQRAGGQWRFYLTSEPDPYK